ncbi:MMPL family transporter [Streptomyces sp. NPDC005180]|uniref:MMPL family transporter n=1 Tax=Streptomyces sp. NPDC005180 TaxID=3156868 RepID=UPI0033AE8D44
MWSSAEAVRVSREDLRVAEMAAAPVVLLILMVTLRSFALVFLPMAIGLVSVSATLGVLNGLTLLMPVSVFAVNVTAALGFGLSVDYGLLVLMRGREEMARGETVGDAVDLAVRSAGRAVLFSAATVIACMAALLVFPVPFLRSLAAGGIAVVAFSALTTVLFYPLLLRRGLLPAARLDRWLSDRVRGALPLRGRKGLGTPEGDAGVPGYSRAWAWWGSAATRRPVLLGASAAVLLLTCALPLGQARFGIADDRVLPEALQMRQTAARVRAAFPDAAGTKLPVVLSVADVREPGSEPGMAAQVDRYARQLSSLHGVAGVDAFTGTYRGGSRTALPGAARHRLAGEKAVLLDVRMAPGVQPPASESLLRQVRALPAFAPRMIGGPPARTADTKKELARRAPLAALVAGASALLVVLCFTGGLFVAFKAVVLAVLSLSAGIGCLVPLFQEGRAGMEGFTVTGQLDISMLLLTVCIALGLSVDYEVFLLARIKEQYAATGDGRSSIIHGMASTGRLISASSLVVVVTMSAMAMSRVTSLKLLGTGLALTVLLDATLVRALLVPAAMQLAGRANWWLPGWARHLRRRVPARGPAAGGPARGRGPAATEWDPGT